MVIAKSKLNGKIKTLLIGLTATATDSLMAGTPIEITRATVGKCAPAHWRIGLVWGKTELDVLNILETAMSKKTRLRLIKKNQKPKKDHK